MKLKLCMIEVPMRHKRRVRCWLRATAADAVTVCLQLLAMIQPWTRSFRLTSLSLNAVLSKNEESKRDSEPFMPYPRDWTWGLMQGQRLWPLPRPCQAPGGSSCSRRRFFRRERGVSKFLASVGFDMAVAQKPGIPKWVALVSGSVDQNLRTPPI